MIKLIFKAYKKTNNFFFYISEMADNYYKKNKGKL